jgi:hypothetical protein
MGRGVDDVQQGVHLGIRPVTVGHNGFIPGGGNGSGKLPGLRDDVYAPQSSLQRVRMKLHVSNAPLVNPISNEYPGHQY